MYYLSDYFLPGALSPPLPWIFLHEMDNWIDEYLWRSMDSVVSSPSKSVPELLE